MFFGLVSIAQTGPYTLRVSFSDKVGSPFKITEPESFLSQKAIERRMVQNIPVTTEDIPVSPAYINELRALGYKPFNPSKWFNSVLIKISDSSEINAINVLDFVLSTEVVAARPLVKKHIEKFYHENIHQPTNMLSDSGLYGLSSEQILLHNGEKLHNQGFTGEGIDVAVIDAGFYRVDQLPAFVHLWENGQILSLRDFVDQDQDVFSEHTHGMKVLSIAGGKINQTFSGTAPGASFHLLRSEDASSEMRIEEDNWVRAAEYADSIGAQIINTSLGYSVFDFPWMNYQYADMDGNTTRISRAAEKAAEKGMLLVLSAGNEGNSEWKFITAPADARNTIATGAIDIDRNLAPFSSLGPTSDGRIKPEVVATGWRTYHQYPDGSIVRGNGTSFSAPIITGLAACLWQANPTASNLEIREAIIRSSSNYSTPNEQIGYGIPDVVIADEYLKFLRSDENLPVIRLTHSSLLNQPVLIIESKEVIDAMTLKFYTLEGRVHKIIHKQPNSAFYQYTIPTDGLNGNSMWLIQVTLPTIQKTFKYIP